jgi:hypothetical protein
MVPAVGAASAAALQRARTPPRPAARAAAAPLAATAAEDGDAAAAAAEARLSAWCAAAGGATPALEIAHFPLPGGARYRGLRATRDVAVGECVALVPLACCLHSQGPADWPHAGATPTARLAARLLQADAATPASPMRPWLDILPRDLASLGAFRFPADQLARDIQGYSPVLRVRARLEALDAVAAPHVLREAGPAADEAALAWANAVVRTRAFEIGQTATDACVLAFVPWLDMINHAHAEPHLEWTWQPEVAAMEVSAVRPLRAGEEATVSYGARDNDSFLLWGGFVSAEPNPLDTVEAFASLAAAAAWWVDGRIGPGLAGRTGAGTVTAVQAAAAAAEVDAAARAAAADAQEREELRTAVCLGASWEVDERLVDLLEALAAGEAGLGPRLADRAAVAAVRLRASQLLGASPTTLAQDEALLRGGELHPHTALCVQFRAAKKRLLHAYLAE